MAEPSTPPPDDKDWTWTLSRPCPECGFAAAEVAVAEVPGLVDAAVARFTARLGEPGAAERPEPQVWSVLEYACHVRDVCDRFDARLRAMLTEDDPLFENWDQDRTALDGRYWTQQPERVAGELSAAAARINATIDSVTTDQLGRPGRRSNGSTFTAQTLTQYFAHDVVHHAHDIGG